MLRKRNLAIVIGVVTALLVLCGTAAGFYWGTGPAPRCLLPAEGPAEPGWSARTVASSGHDRCYYLYVPSGYDPDQPAPVVVSYHGFLSNPESHALVTGWHSLADREGFLVAYPQGTSFPQRWNAGASWGEPEVDDVQFAVDLLKDLSSVAALDRSRVYVNGLSNGGGMTVRLGCELGGLIAALGSVAGAVVELEDCDPPRPVPLMAFHGTADPIVPYEGQDIQGRALRTGAELTDAPSYFVGAEAWVADWAEGNGCAPIAEVIPRQGDVRGVRYSGCEDGAGVILYTIEDGGHTWPGGWPIPAVGKTSTDIDATEKMWAFFEGYRLEEGP